MTRCYARGGERVGVHAGPATGWRFGVCVVLCAAIGTARSGAGGVLSAGDLDATRGVGSRGAVASRGGDTDAGRSPAAATIRQ
mgnify:FL=1